MSKTILIIAALSLIAGLNAGCQDRNGTELYELQEKCSKKAEEFVSKQKYNANHVGHIGSHYNVKLNTCFVDIRLVEIQKDLSGGRSSLMLYDVNENVLHDSLILLLPSQADAIKDPVGYKKKFDENEMKTNKYIENIIPFMTE